jgi:hypothetical protein
MNYKLKDGDKFGYYKTDEGYFIDFIDEMLDKNLEIGWTYPDYIEDPSTELNYSKLKYQAFTSKLIRTLIL